MQVPQRPRARVALAPVDGRRIMWGAAAIRLPKDRGGRRRDRHSFHLFDGDVVEMFDDCQDVYQHAVLAPKMRRRTRAQEYRSCSKTRCSCRPARRATASRAPALVATGKRRKSKSRATSGQAWTTAAAASRRFAVMGTLCYVKGHRRHRVSKIVKAGTEHLGASSIFASPPSSVLLDGLRDRVEEALDRVASSQGRRLEPEVR